MTTYAQQADVESYIEGWVTDDADALDRLIERAERDIDGIVGRWSVEDNGLKFGTPGTDNEKNLQDWQIAALTRAVCAQVEYRVQMGEAFFVEGQHESDSTSDRSTSGKLPYIGPKVWAELEGTGLQRLTGALSGVADRPPWFGFSYNDPDEW